VSGEFFTDEDAEAMVEAGLFERAGVSADGSPLYRLTALGEARAEAYIHGTVEGASLWARLQRIEAE
jgi:hypothetical protein